MLDSQIVMTHFKRGLMFQNVVQLDGFAHLPLTPDTQTRCENVVNAFLTLVNEAGEIAINEILAFGLESTGYKLALQMLDHDEGFHEQNETKTLDSLLVKAITDKTITPFTFELNEGELFIEYWDC